LPDPSTPLVFPELGALYRTLAPVAEALLRVVVGLAMVPHGLRNTFNFFPRTGQPLRSVRSLADYLEEQGYRPGMVWAPAISVVQLVGGPLLALGLFTRPVAVPIVLFLLVTNVERWRVGRYFWNLVHGGGTYSLDHLLFGREF
jgi:putative oxidoreductase